MNNFSNVMDYESFLKASAQIQEYSRRQINQEYAGEVKPNEIAGLMSQVQRFMEQQNQLSSKIEQFIETQNSINNFVLEKLGNCKCAPGNYDQYLNSRKPMTSSFQSTSSHVQSIRSCSTINPADYLGDERFAFDPDGTHCKPYKCPECDKSFRQKHGLHQHMLTHDSVGAFFCDVCGKRYTRQESVNRHKRSTPQCAKPTNLLPQQMLKFQQRFQ